MSGVRTIDDLRLRCRIDEETGCWRFGKATRSAHAPGVRLAALDQRMVTIGVAICFLKTGKLPAKGIFWHCTCSTSHCANPEHRKAGTRKTQMLQAQYRPSALTLARIASTKRARSKLSDEAIAAIRSSTATLKDLAQRFGVSPSHISRIRLGQTWRETAAPAASVFTWRPAA